MLSVGDLVVIKSAPRWRGDRLELNSSLENQLGRIQEIYSNDEIAVALDKKATVTYWPADGGLQSVWTAHYWYFSKDQLELAFTN